MDHREALDVLGLRGPADAAQVKQAYRRLARELHPDAGGDADAFHRVRTAFEAVGSGTDVVTGPAPQERVASVEERWWDAGSAFHEHEVDRTGLDLARPMPEGDAVRMDLELLAAHLARAAPVAPVQLRSRSPGSRLHRIIAWLQPDLLAAMEIGPAATGPRTGHDVVAVVRSAAGSGRRLLATSGTPDGWVRARGSETVRLERRFRPCRDPLDTAVRVAREVDAALDALGWPLGEWFALRA